MWPTPWGSFSGPRRTPSLRGNVSLSMWWGSGRGGNRRGGEEGAEGMGGEGRGIKESLLHCCKTALGANLSLSVSKTHHLLSWVWPLLRLWLPWETALPSGTKLPLDSVMECNRMASLASCGVASSNGTLHCAKLPHLVVLPYLVVERLYLVVFGLPYLVFGRPCLAGDEPSRSRAAALVCWAAASAAPHLGAVGSTGCAPPSD